MHNLNVAATFNGSGGTGGSGGGMAGNVDRGIPSANIGIIPAYDNGGGNSRNGEVVASASSTQIIT